MSTLKTAGRTTGGWGTNWNEPKIRPKRNILRSYVMRLWNFKEQGITIGCTWRRKTKELGWKETQGIQNIGIKDSQGNRIVEQSQVLKIWENYITELYDRPNRPETLEVEPEEELDTDKKGPCFRKYCGFQSIHSQFYICIYIFYCMSRGGHVSASLILGHLQVHRSLCSLQCQVWCGYLLSDNTL